MEDFNPVVPSAKPGDQPPVARLNRRTFLHIDPSGELICIQAANPSPLLKVTEGMTKVLIAHREFHRRQLIQENSARTGRLEENIDVSAKGPIEPNGQLDFSCCLHT